MKKLLLILCIGFTSVSFSQTVVNKELDSKTYEEMITQNRINNLDKFHNIEMHFYYGLESSKDLSIKKLTEEIKKNKDITNCFFDDKIKKLVVIFPKANEKELSTSIKEIIYHEGYNINSFTEAPFRK